MYTISVLLWKLSCIYFCLYPKICYQHLNIYYTYINTYDSGLYISLCMYGYTKPDSDIFNDITELCCPMHVIHMPRIYINPTKIQSFITCIQLSRVSSHCCYPDYIMLPFFAVWSWWRHQMETFSALLALCTGNSLSPVNSPHKGQRRCALMFPLIGAWINDWVNNREAGDMIRHRAHYDVTIMDFRWLITQLCEASRYVSRT